MAWRKVTKRPRGNPLGSDVVTLSKQGVYFPVAFIRSQRLSKAESANVYLDERARLLAFQFINGPKGEYKVHRHEGARPCENSRYAACARAVREVGAKPGQYHIQRQETGYYVVDTKTEVKRA